MIELTNDGIVCNGHKIKLRFGLAVLQKFQNDHGFSLDQVLQNMPECLSVNLLNVVDLMYDALEYSHKRDGLEFEITWDEVEAWFSDNPGLRAVIITAWNDQLPPPVDDKKKEEGTKVTRPKKNP